MKKFITVIFLAVIINSSEHAQDLEADRMLHKLDTARQDTTRVLLMIDLANNYKEISADSAFFTGIKLWHWQGESTFLKVRLER